MPAHQPRGRQRWPARPAYGRLGRPACRIGSNGCRRLWLWAAASGVDGWVGCLAVSEVKGHLRPRVAGIRGSTVALWPVGAVEGLLRALGGPVLFGELDC